MSQNQIDFDFELFTQIVGALTESNVTDIHIAPGTVPFIRQAKELQVLQLPVTDDETGKDYLASIKPMTPEDTRKFAADLLTYANGSQPERAAQMIANIARGKELDTTLSIPHVSRFRAHISLQRTSVCVSLRVVPNELPHISDFPQEILNFVRYSNGLIVVSGKTSSGKSTTLSMLIEEMNHTQSRKIITLEDPIEYLHQHDKCMVVQREIGIDTDSFKTGLVSALREDPDVLVISEMRDMESLEIALNAAESGCLVITTMHSSSAVETLERMISMFPDTKQNQVRSQLATVLRGVVCQQLIPCIRDDYSTPLVAAYEVMTTTSQSIRSAIRKGNLHDIEILIDEQKSNGMKTMADSLKNLKDGELISDEEWYIRNNRLRMSNP